ncbi:hypothetical protein ACFWP3_23570 [Streptomyces sp. NPDC058525]|uniref:hypothetical protein n=1 Tax=Streptomyces sp. NPDC058525 TaxID=3346538 RepID=UPI00365DAB72
MPSLAMVNRAVLAIAGLTLLTAATSAGPWGGFASTLRTSVSQVRNRLPESHTQIALTVVGCLGLLCGLALLALQVRGRTQRSLPLAAARGSLDCRALLRSVRTGCTKVPGVARARCRLTGPGRRKELAIVLYLERGACPQDVLAAVGAGVLPQIAAFLAPRPVHARIRLIVRGAPRPRAA